MTIPDAASASDGDHRHDPPSQKLVLSLLDGFSTPSPLFVILRLPRADRVGQGRERRGSRRFTGPFPCLILLAKRPCKFHLLHGGAHGLGLMDKRGFRGTAVAIF